MLPPEVVDKRELNQGGEDERSARAHPNVDRLQTKKNVSSFHSLKLASAVNGYRELFFVIKVEDLPSYKNCCYVILNACLCRTDIFLFVMWHPKLHFGEM